MKKKSGIKDMTRVKKEIKQNRTLDIGNEKIIVKFILKDYLRGVQLAI